MDKNVIIILNFNDASNTIKLVSKIKNYHSLFKIIVVDNCSTDYSLYTLNQIKGEKVIVLQASKNLGYAAGNNYGADYAVRTYDPEYLFFANPDVLFEESAILKITAALGSNSHFACGTVLVENGLNIWDKCSFFGTIRSLFLVSFYLHKKSVRNHIKRQKDIAEAGVIEGSFFGIKAKVFRQIQGFDERTFLYYEECILAKKLEKYNYKSIVINSEVYQHLHSATISKEYRSKAKAYQNYKNSIMIYAVHYLKIDKLKLYILLFLYYIGLLERYIYDFIKRLKL